MAQASPVDGHDPSSRCSHRPTVSHSASRGISATAELLFKLRLTCADYWTDLCRWSYRCTAVEPGQTPWTCRSGRCDCVRGVWAAGSSERMMTSQSLVLLQPSSLQLSPVTPSPASHSPPGTDSASEWLTRVRTRLKRHVRVRHNAASHKQFVFCLS